MQTQLEPLMDRTTKYTHHTSISTTWN